MDINTRFLLTERNIRGQLVQLDATTRAALANADYPASVAAQLGQALAATAALAGTVKLQGSIILQLQGKGAMPLLVAQASHQGELRGLASFDAERAHQADFATLAGDGRIVITIDGQDRQRYQGIVAIEGDSLSACLGDYFARSEQLATQLYLAADGDKAAALLLQQLPPSSGDDSHTDSDDWQYATTLAATLSDTELLTLPAEELVHRLFHADEVQLFEPQKLRFYCSCSRDKVAAAIRGLGQQEAELLVAEQGQIRVDCEFCNHAYEFDAIDLATVFNPSAVTLAGATEPPQLH